MIRRKDVHWEMPSRISLARAGNVIYALVYARLSNDERRWMRATFGFDLFGNVAMDAEEEGAVFICGIAVEDRWTLNRMTDDEADACIVEHGYHPDLCRHCGQRKRQDGKSMCAACSAWWDAEYERSLGLYGKEPE